MVYSSRTPPHRFVALVRPDALCGGKERFEDCALIAPTKLSGRSPFCCQEHTVRTPRAPCYPSPILRHLGRPVICQMHHVHQDEQMLPYWATRNPWKRTRVLV